MTNRTYGTICSLAKACEIVEPRWTLPILNELWNGYSRFNDIRRAVGNISPGVLSKRLAEMEKAGLVQRLENRATGSVDYVRTSKAIALEDAMHALARWAQCNIDAEVALAESDLSQMMWAMRRSFKPEHFPPRRVVIRFHFSDETGQFPTYWLIAEPGNEVEVCVEVPDFDVTLYIETTKVSFNAIFLGRSTVAREIEAGRLFATGDKVLEGTMERWLPRSAYADLEGIRMLRRQDQ